MAVGRNHIGLTNAPIRLPDGRKTFQPLFSPIVREIPPGPEVTLPTIDLLEEAIRDQKVIVAPNSPSIGVLVAMIEVNGAPVELMQIDHSVRKDL